MLLENLAGSPDFFFKFIDLASGHVYTRFCYKRAHRNCPEKWSREEIVKIGSTRISYIQFSYT